VVIGRISDELCASTSGIVVQYLDDEDDWITVATEGYTRAISCILLLGHQ